MASNFVSFQCGLGNIFFSKRKPFELARFLLWGKIQKKLGGAALLCLFWMERNKRSFKDIEQFDQTIKYSFMCTFLDWVRVNIDDHSLTMIGFLDWLSSKWAEGGLHCVFVVVPLLRCL